MKQINNRILATDYMFLYLKQTHQNRNGFCLCKRHHNDLQSSDQLFIVYFDFSKPGKEIILFCITCVAYKIKY